MPWVIELRVVSLPATASRMTKNPNSSSESLWPSTSASTSLVTMSSPGVRGPVGGHLHGVHDQLDRGGHGVVGLELGVLVADHLVGPVEQLHPVFLRHTQQAGDGLQRKFARHLLDEVAGPLRRRGLHDLPGPLAQVVAQALDGPRREAAGDDLAQVGVLRGVHVEQDELAALDLLADRAVFVARQRGLLQAGEDVAAPRNLFDVLVFGHHPEPAVVESARPQRLLVPPDRRGPPQLGQFFDRQPLGVDVGIGEIESGREIRSRHQWHSYDEYDLDMTRSGPVKHRDSRDGTASRRIADRRIGTCSRARLR